MNNIQKKLQSISLVEEIKKRTKQKRLVTVQYRRRLILRDPRADYLIDSNKVQSVQRCKSTANTGLCQVCSRFRIALRGHGYMCSSGALNLKIKRGHEK